MKLTNYLPAAILRPFVKTFLIIESEDGMDNRILPDTSIVLAFRLSGKVTFREDGEEYDIPAAGISGIRKSSRFIHYAGDTANLLVIFHEAGAAAFFHEPLHELYESNVPLDHFIPRNRMDGISERLAEAENDRQRISIVESFLLARMKQNRPDLLIMDAIRQIKLWKGNMRIKELASGLHISQDPFEKRFRRVTGASPKQFSTIVRLRNLIEQYPHTANLTDAAHTAGYFDQAHFIRDFKLFTGETPHSFFTSASFW